MPVYMLDQRLLFPPPEMAEPEGLLAVGGDLSPERLMLAYSMGIFPWYSEGEPILWWSTDPRLVLFPDELKLSRSMRQVISRGVFDITFDRDFSGVINACASAPRARGEGTWITPEMTEAYIRLHEIGHAHSVEAWHEGMLAGGLYGIAMGGAFFGESMFSLESNASKAALAGLVGKLKVWGFSLIDCQMSTAHLKSMGARDLPRKRFLKLLADAIRLEGRPGLWNKPDPSA